MHLQEFKAWLARKFGGLTVARVFADAGITSGTNGADGVDGADGVAADLAALAAITTVGDNDLLLVQVEGVYKKITFANLVTAITTAQGA